MSGDAPPDLPLVVGGVGVAPVSWVAREDPARPEVVVGRVAAGDADVADAAIRSAEAAFGGWSARPVAERGALLRAAVGAVAVQADDLAVLLARELGKVLPDCRGEIAFAQAFVAYCTEVAERSLVERVTDDAEGRLTVHLEPYGVVGAITPWNAPVILALLKVAPALATGNTVVVKPSPLVPLTVTQVLHTMAARLPTGVLTVVNGGGDVGAAIAGHPLVRKVAFTGGGRIARAVMRSAAEQLTPLVLELGGNDPAVFLDDADLGDETLHRAVLGTFLTGGQVCMAAKRLYVHRSRLEEFTERYVAVARTALVLGDPLQEGVTVGPMASRAQVEHVSGLVADARRRGGTVTPLGTLADEALVAGGYFLRPVLVTGVTDDAPIVATEQFGPAVPLLAFDDEDEVVARANAGQGGLASSVWSRDEDRAFALARRIRAGFTFVNTHNRTGLALRAPFGGMGRSGFGREFGEEGVREYVQTHAVNLPATVRGGAGSASAYPGT